jgi:hypothetical protein
MLLKSRKRLNIKPDTHAVQSHAGFRKGAKDTSADFLCQITSETCSRSKKIGGLPRKGAVLGLLGKRTFLGICRSIWTERNEHLIVVSLGAGTVQTVKKSQV